MEIKNGKKPLSARPKPQAPTSLEDIFGNPLTVSDDIKRAVEEKGMECRWINFKKFQDIGNSHEYAWRPLKRSECGIMDSTSLINGSDPDGYVRRGDLVLAGRSKELSEKHRLYLKGQANRYKNLQKSHAEELRSFVKKAGIDASITEGYGEDESEE